MLLFRAFRWIMRGLAYWPTTGSAIIIAGGFGYLHLIGPERVAALTTEVAGIGGLISALANAGLALPVLISAGLALWRPPSKPEGNDHGNLQ